MLAAAPAWFADNVGWIALGTLVALTVVVLRMVQKLVLRLALLGLIAAVGLFSYANRDALRDCSRTCHCRVADRQIDVPFCDPDLGF